MDKAGPPPAYAQHPPQYGHPSTLQNGQQPPPIVTGPQPSYNPYTAQNNNTMMSNNVVVGGAVPVNAGPVIIRTQPRGGDSCCSADSTMPKFNTTAGKTTGLILLMGGIITIIVITVSLIARSYYGVGGLGSSLGASIFFYIPTGILGACSYERSSCVVVSFLIMCILTTIEAFAMTAYEGVAAGLLSYDLVCAWIFCDWEQNVVVVAMHAIACVVAFVMFIAAFTGSIYACLGMNNNVTPSSTVVVTGQPAYNNLQSTTVHVASTFARTYDDAQTLRAEGTK